MGSEQQRAQYRQSGVSELNLCGKPQAMVSDQFQAVALQHIGIVKLPIDSLGELALPEEFERLLERCRDDRFSRPGHVA